MPSLNRNTQLALVYSPLLTMCSSLCTSTTLSAFILLIKRDKTAVGIATGTQGALNMLLAVPAGTLADRVGRQLLLRLSSVVLLLASTFGAVSLLYLQLHVSPDSLYLYLLGMSCLWGAFMGLHSAPLEALFGDSVESGSRSQVYVWRASLRTLGAALGPAVSAAIFAVYGDDWKLVELTWVMLVGIFGATVPAAMLWGFRDSAAIGEAAEGLHVQEQRRAARAAANAGNQGASALNGDETQGNGEAAKPGPQRQCRWPRPEHIAPMIALSDLLSMLGSGMTIKFFSLFFWQDLHLRPVAVSLIYVAGPVGISVSGLLAQRLSLRIGRIETSLACRSTGVALLITLAFVQEPLIVVPLYLLRTWLMNCTQGLSKSVLNDYVSKRHRAKWNSLESINVFSWSGSALVGGWLCDTIGYRHTFLITAALQACAVLLSAPLAMLVAAEKSARGGLGSPRLRTPLLSTSSAEEHGAHPNVQVRSPA